MNNEMWVNGKIKSIKKWNKTIFSLIFNANIYPFIPGQFGRIKIKYLNKYFQRAYSYINKSKSKNLEFLINKIDEGIVSNILFNKKPGEEIFISKKSYGTLIINNISNRKTLWMLSTGTGIGPYISILRSNKNLNNFKNIVLVNSVRLFDDLIYLPLINKIKNKINKFHFISIISREKKEGILFGRIPNLILNGELENKVNIKIDLINDYIMICGNPNMVSDTKNILENISYKKNILNLEKNISYERYW